MKKLYPQHHDHNNNGHTIYQNLTPLHSNHIKSETHSPLEEANKAMAPGECKSSDVTSNVSHLTGNHELNVDMSSERPRCWTKI